MLRQVMKRLLGKKVSLGIRQIIDRPSRKKNPFPRRVRHAPADPPTNMRLFCSGIVQNVRKSIPVIEKFLLDLKCKIPKTEVYIYENNSTDGTPLELRGLSFRNPFIHVRCDFFDLQAFKDRGRAQTWDNRPCRIELIAHARNALLDWIRESGLAHDDRLLMIDLDFTKPPTIEPLVQWIWSMSDDVDALFANGQDTSGDYYDHYALRTAICPLGPEVLGEDFWSGLRQFKFRVGTSQTLIPVSSAFGGLAIYRANAIEGCSYSAYPTPALHAYYQEQFKDNSANAQIRHVVRKKMQTHVDMLGAYLFGPDIFYCNNSGFNYPIVSEHTNFHMQMRARGRRNIFIAPSLEYFWGPV